MLLPIMPFGGKSILKITVQRTACYICFQQVLFFSIPRVRLYDWERYGATAPIALFISIIVVFRLLDNYYSRIPMVR